MALETITEPAFLLTELRYTLGQLHVQALDLDEEARRAACHEGRSIEETLADMVRYEKEYQARYSELLHRPDESGGKQVEATLLPVNEAEDAHGTESDFEHLRGGTIVILEQAPDPWPQGLVDLVREQVARDRQSTTHIAECRKSWLGREQRPDLQEPLTATKEPHVLGEESTPG